LSTGRIPDYAAAGPFAVASDEGEWHDGRHQRRLRWRHYRPRGAAETARVLYSHGLGGSRDSGADWLAHWASWGIGTIALQHPGTDAEALAGRSPLAMRHLLRRAADPEELALRQHDLLFALDRVAAGADLPLGIAGHSFGAVSATRLIGERRGRHDTPADPRLKAAILFSPSARGGLLPLDERYRAIAVPNLHLTGSEDHGIGPGDIDASARSLPFAHIAAAHRGLLVLAGARHGDLAGDTRHPRLTPILQAASTAFLRRHLTGDANAAAWLQQALPAMLDGNDRVDMRAPGR